MNRIDKELDVALFIRKQLMMEALLKAMATGRQWRVAAKYKRLVVDSESSLTEGETSGSEFIPET